MHKKGAFQYWCSQGMLFGGVELNRQVKKTLAPLTQTLLTMFIHSLFIGITLMLREMTFEELSVNITRPEFHLLHWPFFASLILIFSAIMSLVCSLCSEPGYVKKMSLANSNNIIGKIS